MNNNIKWQLRPTYTEGDKFHNGDTEIFKSGKWAFLTREVIQNSNDAFDSMKDESGKLVMKFSMENLPINAFPDLENLKKHINGTYSINNLPETCKSFCESALKTLSRESIKIMKISDFNTSGVLGSNDLNNIKSQWRALIYDEGNSQKDSRQAAGSFGLGKNAPFALSGINTVFYTTKDKDGLYAFEGVAKLHTSYIDDQKYEPKIYFSNLYNNKTIPLNYDDCKDINDIFKRDIKGTDIFIMDVDYDEDKIKKEMIQAVVENFFIRIQNCKLEVDMFGELINKDSLLNIVMKYCDQPIEYTNSNIRYGYIKQYLNTYLGKYEKTKIYNEEVPGVGKLKLFIAIDPDINGKWVAMFRTKGMKIFDYNYRLAQQQFSAIFMPDDPDVDEFLRSIENPTHDLFDPEIRISDKDKKIIAQQRYDKIINWIKGKIVEFTKINVDEQDFLDGMEEYIQLLDEDESKERKVKQPDIEIISYEPKKQRINMSILDNAGSEKLVEPEPEPDDGIIDHTNSLEVSVPNDEKGSGKQSIVKDYHNNFSVKPKIISYNNTLRTAFGIENLDIDTINLEILTVGEDDNISDFIPKILKAVDCVNNVELKVDNNKILNIKNEKTNVIEIIFERDFQAKYKISVYTVKAMEDL
ncbi:MAG: hypothetical protein IJN13_03330 [Bacilli bacterium]|nr:hypothetical protein [Bacilli bacterium]